MIVMALLLTHDNDALVRAESGRCLAAITRRRDRHRALLDQRLLELLSRGRAGSAATRATRPAEGIV